MKISETWLREWVSPNIDTNTLVEQLTMAGIEVDALEPVAGMFSGVVVGEIISIEQHPDADKLRVCQVAGGTEPLTQVVCGAANARVGIKIPFATVGAKLPGDFKIKKAKLRGVESFGMLCGQTELEAGDDDSGLWELNVEATVGVDLREYLNLNDSVIEVDITPNRSDCLSVKGIARDVGVINRLAVTEPAIAATKATIDDSKAVTLTASEACSHYVGRVIRNINTQAPSPLWLQEKLRRSGVRSIDAVVDVTNYVLLELGQPMHAFDLACLEGDIDVRFATSGEKITLLSDEEIELTEQTLVIADAKGPQAMAGIMGGKGSAVSAATRDIFLESAFFHPVQIAGRARSYGLHTDSSHRFERGVDSQLQAPAIERATALLLSIVGGEAGPVVEVTSEHHPADRTVSLRRKSIATGLGISFEDTEVVDILGRLGLNLLETTAEGWGFSIPSWRFDIAIEADLLEELARIYGYNNLPTSVPTSKMAIRSCTETTIELATLRNNLVAKGYQEVVTYSFVDPELNQKLDPGSTPIALKNPISADMGVMRTTLLAGLISSLRYNLNRQQERVMLFESGQCFIPHEAGVSQEAALAGLIFGNRTEESWANTETPVDFYDIKGDVESLLKLTGLAGEFTFVASSHPALHPGQCAELQFAGKKCGFVGALHPEVARSLDVPNGVFIFQIELNALLGAKVPAFTPLSKFPVVRRDLALLVESDLPVQSLINGAKQHAGEHLKDLKVFDLYVGKGIDPHRKSIALGLTFQHPSRTLTDEETNNAIDAVVEHLKAAFGATLR